KGRHQVCKEKKGKKTKSSTLARPTLAVTRPLGTHRAAPFSRFSFLFISRQTRSASFKASGYPCCVERWTISRERSREIRLPTETKIGRARPGGIHAYPCTRPRNSIGSACSEPRRFVFTRPTNGCFATPTVGRPRRTPT